MSELRLELAEGRWAPSALHRFSIRDPKPRIIHAPPFRDRVAHHAVMAHVGPVLDKALIDDTYACREGKGALAAVQRARRHAGRYAWFAQIDIRAYFASIPHDRLLALLARRFKSAGLLALMERLVRSQQDAPGRGLPIGTLPSQHFANFYLGGLDRLLVENRGVLGMVRYMDDVVWWGEDRSAVRDVLARAIEFLADDLGLEVKRPVRVGRSADGLSFCGFRILPGRLLLSRRRRRRYRELRARAELSCLGQRIDGLKLQAAYAAALAITAHAGAVRWRMEELRRRPLDPALEEI